MSLFSRALILIVCVAFMVSAGSVCAYVHLDGSAISITSQGTIPMTPGPLLDDFSNNAGVSCWGTTSSTVTKSGTAASITSSYQLDSALTYGASGKSLQLNYNVTPTDSWASYVISLGDQSIAGYNYLSFWIKGSPVTTAQHELFKIELHHTSYNPDGAAGTNNNYKAEVYVTDYLDGGVTNTVWKKVTIPLDAFANIVDRSTMKELVITFENTQSTLNNSPVSGTIYIDNISFGKQFLGVVRIDHFGDKVSKNALGGNCGHTSGGTGPYGSYSYSGTSGQYYGFPNGLVFNFTDVYDPRYYAYFSVIGGGDNGGVQQSRDFRAYSKFCFSVKSSSSLLTCLKVELHCPTSSSNYFHFLNVDHGTESITTNWTDFKIALSSFTTQGWAGSGTAITDGVPPAVQSLGEVVITRDGWMSNAGWSDWDPGQSSGTFYIDNVRLEINGYTPDTATPAQPSAPTASPSGNIVTLTSTASSRITDPSMECVYFIYYDASGNRHDIGYDYNTEDNSYSVKWDVSSLPSRTYLIRAVVMDAANNQLTSSDAYYTKP